jgi:hypothetical protein
MRPFIRTVRLEPFLPILMWALRTLNSAWWRVVGQVIEAHYLFGTSYDDIDVVIHPQSIIHSLIETQVRARSITIEWKPWQVSSSLVMSTLQGVHHLHRV